MFVVLAAIAASLLAACATLRLLRRRKSPFAQLRLPLNLASTPDVEFAFHECGHSSDPLVLVIHGFPDTAASFCAVLPCLAQQGGACAANVAAAKEAQPSAYFLRIMYHALLKHVPSQVTTLSLPICQATFPHLSQPVTITAWCHLPSSNSVYLPASHCSIHPLSRRSQSLEPSFNSQRLSAIAKPPSSGWSTIIARALRCKHLAP